jgi:hypothetical protein
MISEDVSCGPCMPCVSTSDQQTLANSLSKAPTKVGPLASIPWPLIALHSPNTFLGADFQPVGGVSTFSSRLSFSKTPSRTHSGTVGQRTVIISLD